MIKITINPDEFYVKEMEKRIKNINILTQEPFILLDIKIRSGKTSIANLHESYLKTENEFI